MKYVLTRASHSAGQVYVRRFNGAGTPQVSQNILDAQFFDNKEEVDWLLRDIDYFQAIELTDKEVFEMRLKG